MSETTKKTQFEESRGVLSVVLMLLLAGIFTILFVAGYLNNEAQNAFSSNDHERPTATETR